MAGFLAATEVGAQRYAVLVADEPAGTVVIRDPWLHGPYLHLIGLLPPFHGLGVGSRVLDWMEAEAQGRYRNLWLCVSEFNDGARRLYERHGFALAGRLDSLVFDGLTELLMRKRILR
jgi:ribosomal protein S18 acetylase RimI-like enzyme